MADRDYIREQNIPLEVKLKTLVTDIKFHVVGTVKKVYPSGSRVDVVLPHLTCNMTPVILQGIEVLRMGTSKVQVKYKPNVGDVVIVLAMQNYWSAVKTNTVPAKSEINAQPYSTVTMKAILVQSNEESTDATVIEVSENAVDINTSLDVTLKCNKLTINDHLEVT